MDHDRLFKLLLTTFFVEFIELFLPDVSKYLDRNSLQFLDKEIFTDIASGERHEVDLVVKARFRGKQTFFLIHIENQARSQTGLCRRIFEYFGLLHNKHRLPVLPVVVAYLKLTASETIVYNRELAATAPKQRKSIMQMTNSWVEKGRLEGRTEGHVEGRTEGRLEGRRDFVVGLLRHRFGSVPASISERVSGLKDSHLDRLGRALMDFDTIGDARAWLDRAEVAATRTRSVRKSTRR